MAYLRGEDGARYNLMEWLNGFGNRWWRCLIRATELLQMLLGVS